MGDESRGRFDWTQGTAARDFDVFVKELGGLRQAKPRKILAKMLAYNHDLNYDQIKSHLKYERDKAEKLVQDSKIQQQKQQMQQSYNHGLNYDQIQSHLKYDRDKEERLVQDQQKMQQQQQHQLPPYVMDLQKLTQAPFTQVPFSSAPTQQQIQSLYLQQQEVPQQTNFQGQMVDNNVNDDTVNNIKSNNNINNRFVPMKSQQVYVENNTINNNVVNVNQYGSQTGNSSVPVQQLQPLRQLGNQQKKYSNFSSQTNQRVIVDDGNDISNSQYINKVVKSQNNDKSPFDDQVPAGLAEFLGNGQKQFKEGTGTLLEDGPFAQVGGTNGHIWENTSGVTEKILMSGMTDVLDSMNKMSIDDMGNILETISALPNNQHQIGVDEENDVSQEDILKMYTLPKQKTQQDVSCNKQQYDCQRVYGSKQTSTEGQHGNQQVKDVGKDNKDGQERIEKQSGGDEAALDLWKEDIKLLNSSVSNMSIDEIFEKMNSGQGSKSFNPALSSLPLNEINIKEYLMCDSFGNSLPSSQLPMQTSNMKAFFSSEMVDSGSLGENIKNNDKPNDNNYNTYINQSYYSKGVEYAQKFSNAQNLQTGLVGQFGTKQNNNNNNNSNSNYQQKMYIDHLQHNISVGDNTLHQQGSFSFDKMNNINNDDKQYFYCAPKYNYDNSVSNFSLNSQHGNFGQQGNVQNQHQQNYMYFSETVGLRSNLVNEVQNQQQQSFGNIGFSEQDYRGVVGGYNQVGNNNQNFSGYQAMKYNGNQAQELVGPAVVTGDPSYLERYCKRNYDAGSFAILGDD